MKPRQILPVLLLCGLLAACAETTLSTRGLPAPSIPSDGALSLRLERTVWSGSAEDADGVTLAEYAYDVPEILFFRQENGTGVPVTAENARTAAEKQALTAAEAFNDRFRTWADDADFDALADQAREDRLLLGGEEWLAYYQGLEDTVFYQEGSLISVSGTFYYYGGGAHPNTLLLGWNFDMETGRFLTAGQLFDGPDEIAAELVRQADARATDFGEKPEDYFWPDYREILAGWEDDVVTFTASDMVVSYSPYDIAPYAAGPQVFTIPRQMLEPYLNNYGRSLLG